MKNPRKRKLKDTLFDCSKLTGQVADTPGDEIVANGVVTQCGEIIGTLGKIGPKMRVAAIRQIAKLCEAVSPSVNCAVFKKHKEAPAEPELPLVAPAIEMELI